MASDKVLAYITRNRNGRTEILVFDHVGQPEAGTQVPAGTVQPGEPLAAAALREVEEETGVTGLTITRYLGCFPYRHEPRRELHRRHVFLLTASRPLPEAWTHTVSGQGEDTELTFRWSWLDLRLARSTLAGRQGDDREQVSL